MEVKSRQNRIMDKLYSQRNETGDVTFIVQKWKIHAHKSVLAASSPKYAAQFYGPLQDKGDIVVENISPVAFETFLQFFYLQKAEITLFNVEEVLDHAKQSLVGEFVEECVDYLKTVPDVCFVLRVAILHDLHELKNVQLMYLSENTLCVLTSQAFLANCTRGVLLEILKLESINCSEIALFGACISWAKARCIEKNLNAANTSNLRAEIGDAVYEIRFRAMSLNDFVKLYSSIEGFFAPDEMQEIMYIIGDLQDFKPTKFNQKNHRNVRNRGLEEFLSFPEVDQSRRRLGKKFKMGLDWKNMKLKN